MTNRILKLLYRGVQRFNLHRGVEQLGEEREMEDIGIINDKN